jgi:hypothetical protein
MDRISLSPNEVAMPIRNQTSQILPSCTLDEVAERLALEEGGPRLSRERVRQIERDALNRLRTELEKRGVTVEWLREFETTSGRSFYR